MMKLDFDWQWVTKNTNLDPETIIKTSSGLEAVVVHGDDAACLEGPNQDKFFVVSRSSHRPSRIKPGEIRCKIPRRCTFADLDVGAYFAEEEGQIGRHYYIKVNFREALFVFVEDGGIVRFADVATVVDQQRVLRPVLARKS